MERLIIRLMGIRGLTMEVLPFNFVMVECTVVRLIRRGMFARLRRITWVIANGTLQELGPPVP